MHGRFRGRGRRTTLALAAVSSAVAVATTVAATPAAAKSNTPSVGTGIADACAALTATPRQADPQLLGGVTVHPDATAGVFPAGVAPTAIVAAPAGFSAPLHYIVRNRAALVSSFDSAADRVALPSTPGWYSVLASNPALGSTCFWYGVQARSAKPLDLASLPAGADWGGGGPERDVALHAQLGLPVVRRGVDLNATGPDAGLAAAAADARRLGERMVVQVGQGGPVETAAVKAGTWEALVRRVVAANPSVRYWEAWNEPNTSMFFYGSVTDYVRKVLTPFARAVRSVAPGAVVVGGSALADDPEWWTSFAKLGGFRLVDVVGVHPYTWSWGAPETEGMWSVLKRVRTLANAGGGRGKQIWDTESGFPSAWDGTGSSMWTQSDFVARKLLLERALGVASGEFLLEGGWQDWPVIDMFRGVKPGALSLTTATSFVGKRAFRSFGSTGKKGLWSLRFSGLTALWSSAARPVAVKLKPRCALTVADAFGAVSVVRGRSLTVGSSPSYVVGGTGCLKGA